MLRILTLRKAVHPRNGVIAYGIVRSASRRKNHTVTKVSYKWRCTCERATLGNSICDHIRLARNTMAKRGAR